MTRKCHVPFWRAVGGATLSLTLILAIWDYRSCPVDSRKAVSVMDTDNLQDGVFDNPLNLMKAINGRAVQLELFDSTKYGTSTQESHARSIASFRR